MGGIWCPGLSIFMLLWEGFSMSFLLSHTNSDMEVCSLQCCFDQYILLTRFVLWTHDSCISYCR